MTSIPHATAPTTSLTAAIARVRAQLEWREAGQTALALDRCDPPELQLLEFAFGLTPFERDVLLLAAGMEMDATFGECCAKAHGDAHRLYPTFGLALAALSEPHWSALLPSAPLRRWRLLTVDEEDGLTIGRLRIDERVLHHLAGESYLDASLRGLFVPAAPSTELTPSHGEIANATVAAWSFDIPFGAWPIVQYLTTDRSDAEAIAAKTCARLGLVLYSARAEELAMADSKDAVATTWDREAILSGVALFIDGCGTWEAEVVRRLTAILERVRGPVIVASREPLRDCRRNVVRFDVPPPPKSEQVAAWRGALGDRAERLNGQLQELVSQFRLPVSAIRTVASATPEDRLWDACRAESRPKLDDLAQRIDSTASWDDLVLPEAPLELLRQIAAQVRRRAQVYENWGFGARSGRGLGITSLFAGPSGTGKTLAAEVLAKHLQLDLYRIDLSQTVSKYIGETERNLSRIFEAAEAGGAVLLFDEADALFGRRSEVKDSHDRYANLEVSYLLQRMETYHGLAVLTTNLKDSLDPAFQRRLRFVVAFPFPDIVQRARIWQRAFPAQTPTAGLDVSRLSRLAVSGGSIRNIALSAAFLAAEADEPVRMAHVLRAGRAEYAKLDKVLTEADAGGWE